MLLKIKCLDSFKLYNFDYGEFWEFTTIFNSKIN